MNILLNYLFAMILVTPVIALSNPVDSPKVLMIDVDSATRLEVLDFGGVGTPLIFLAGLGGTAHSFDGLAQRFTLHHHVFAITRRGFGASSHSPAFDENYSPEKFATDIVAVLSKLGIRKAYIAGHSIAGEELSELDKSYPDMLYGLIYLDAAYTFAFYGESSTELYPLAGQIKRDLSALVGAQPSEIRSTIARLQGEIPRLQPGLERLLQAAQKMPDRPNENSSPPVIAIENAIYKNEKIYGSLNAPLLSIIAYPP